MTAADHSPLAPMLSFLETIGLPVREAELGEGDFLPGVRIEKGELLFDRGTLRWPGDLLHEAGHLALLPKARDPDAGGKLNVAPAEEMAVLAWSYAAAVAAGVDPLVVFHEGGYRQGGAQLAAQYASGGGPGVPILQWFGMTNDFPRMRHWWRPEDSPKIES